ncbi:deazapurine DNA modification protein DpdA family protein [Nocardia niigatensis]
MKFYLGTHQPHWLTCTTEALFISDTRLRHRKTFPRAQGEWALDSGGFTQLQKHGSWDTVTPRQYVDRVRRYRDEIGNLAWAAPQDWMCEPIIIHGGRIGKTVFAGTHLTVNEHLHRSVGNLIDLRSLDSALPIAPTVQGFKRRDYELCLDLYAKAGIDLAAEPIVAIGSVCRRQNTREAAEIITAITDAVPGIRLHGFGIKTSGLADYGSALASSDSTAWSDTARKEKILLPGCTGHMTCANCIRWAFQWREKVLASLAGHATRTPLCAKPSRRSVSRRLDTTTRASHRLALSGFRDEAARLERDTSIRWAHRDGMTISEIATLMDLKPVRVEEILADVDHEPVVDQLRALRQKWGVDAEPATRAAADHIIAILAAAELADTAPEPAGARRHHQKTGSTDPTLFDIA